MAELTGVGVRNKWIKFFEQSDAQGSDADFNDATIGDFAFAFDEVPFDEFVEEAGDVGSPRDELFCQSKSGQAGGENFTEESQRVVLLSRDAVATEEFVFEGAQSIVGSPEIEVGLLFQRIKTWGWQ